MHFKGIKFAIFQSLYEQSFMLPVSVKCWILN